MSTGEVATRLDLDRPVGDDEHEDHTDAGEIRRHSLLTSLAGMAVYGTALVTSPLTARALGDAGRGDLTAVVAPTQVYMWLLTFGLPLATLYFARQFPARQLVMGAWVFATAAGSLLAAGMWWLVPRYLSGHDPETVVWFRAFLLAAIPFVPCYVSLDLLLARKRVREYNLLRLLPYLFNLVALVVLFVADRLDLRSALAATFGAHLLWFVIVFAYLRTWPGRGFSRDVLRSQLHYGARVAPGTLSEFVVARLDQLLLVGLIASAALGQYAVAVNVAGVSQPIAYGITATVFPRLRAIREERQAVELNRMAVRYAWLSSLAISGAIALTVPFVLPFVFGEDFRNAVHLVLLLLPGQVFQNVGIVLAGRLQAVGRPGRASQAQLLAALVTMVGLALFIGPFGVEAAAVVTSSSQLAYLLYVWGAVRLAPVVDAQGRPAASA